MYEMSSDKIFTNENLFDYLKILAKKYKKISGKNVPAEITLIGGASVLANYGFRDSTNDIDAIISASSAMKQAINNVADEYNLPNNWLNSDFTKTSSYTPRLIEISKYRCCLNNILTIRYVDEEYLVAMKLKSFRKYKNDISDIVGILEQQEKNGNPLTIDRINNAVIFLYGSWDNFPDGAKEMIENILQNKNYTDILNAVRKEEKENQDVLLNFADKYPDTITEENIDTILNKIQNLK